MGPVLRMAFQDFWLVFIGGYFGSMAYFRGFKSCG